MKVVALMIKPLTYESNLSVLFWLYKEHNRGELYDQPILPIFMAILGYTKKSASEAIVAN